MTQGQAARPGFWTVVRLLLVVSRKRAVGRTMRQRELFRRRAGKKATRWSGWGFIFGIALMALVNGLAAQLVSGAVSAGERIEAERHGRIVVDRWFAHDLRDDAPPAARGRETDRWLESDIRLEARQIARDYGGSEDAIADRLRRAVRAHGDRDFVTEATAVPGLTGLPGTGTFPALLGSLALLWWSVMLVFQGEGLELDTQRRRHPMWEWLFSHPVPAGAVFLAEMLSPIVANPIYCSGPLFAGILYGHVYGPAWGVLALFAVGVPVTVAAACLGKALEIGVTLRLSPRSRGATIGLMSWLGYAAMLMTFVATVEIKKIMTLLAGLLEPLAVLPWPYLGLFLGQRADGGFSFPMGMLACWVGAGITLAGSVACSAWGAQRGLSGSFGRADAAPKAARNRGFGFGGDPLYRKELLWFMRDRSAVVQAILIPLTMASFQLFNLRGMLAEAQSAWNYLCGAAILFGTYFLVVLGPKSLASEGTALWLALTWPRGLESLLKAKARLWSLISSAIVAPVLCYAAYLYPDSAWKVALVGVGWLVFARSMAEKAVTLASVASSSGEMDKIPSGRRWATMLGMLTYSIGVLTQQWTVALMGVVYSIMTAAAMWQNFRARLPYLYDPWSEELPPAPSLMHAMIAISILVEGGAVLTGASLVLVGLDNIAVARAVIYGVCAALVSLGVANFLGNRGVAWTEIWIWRPAGRDTAPPQPWWRLAQAGTGRLLPSLMMGAGLGLALGLVGLGYLAALHHLPETAEMLDRYDAQVAAVPHLRTALFVMAVLIAPVTEEYLFRGLLYRALDREWGGWLAVVGSAGFFAIYHPPLSWLPVGLVGVANALLFKKTGSLAPAVVLHMVYNAVVLG